MTIPSLRYSLRYLLAKTHGLHRFHQRYYPQDGLIQIFAEGVKGIELGRCGLLRVQPNMAILNDLVINRPWRRRGIGTKLLKQAIILAAALRVESIRGYLTSADLKEFPRLLDWYRRFGFRDVPLLDVANHNARLGIELRL